MLIPQNAFNKIFPQQCYQCKHAAQKRRYSHRWIPSNHCNCVKSSPRNPTNVYMASIYEINSFSHPSHWITMVHRYNFPRFLCYTRSWFKRIEFHSITITKEKLHKNSDDEKNSHVQLTTFEHFVSSDSCSFNSDGGMYWVNISCMKWIIYATKRIFMIFFPLSLSLCEKAASTEEMEFSDIACIDRNEYRDSLRWVMKFSDWTFKWKIFLFSLRFWKLASSCCSSHECSIAMFNACCKIYLWKLLWYFLCVCVWVEHLKKQHIVINSSNIEFILENIIKFSCKENCSCCV